MTNNNENNNINRELHIIVNGDDPQSIMTVYNKASEVSGEFDVIFEFIKMEIEKSVKVLNGVNVAIITLNAFGSNNPMNVFNAKANLVNKVAASCNCRVMAMF